MDGGTADLLRQGMIAVVQDGTASRLDDRRPEASRSGQDGHRPDRLERQLARRSSASPDPGEAPSVAVAVIVEVSRASEQTGGRVAAPIAAAVMRQALEQPAAPPDQESGDSDSGGEQ